MSNPFNDPTFIHNVPMNIDVAREIMIALFERMVTLERLSNKTADDFERTQLAGHGMVTQQAIRKFMDRFPT